MHAINEKQQKKKKTTCRNGCWSITKCNRFSRKFWSSRSFDYHCKTKKEIVKNVFENEKPESPWRSTRKNDDCVIDCACEEDSVKVANVK